MKTEKSHLAQVRAKHFMDDAKQWNIYSSQHIQGTHHASYYNVNTCKKCHLSKISTDKKKKESY